MKMWYPYKRGQSGSTERMNFKKGGSGWPALFDSEGWSVTNRGVRVVT
jgi:hypothetical protein